MRWKIFALATAAVFVLGIFSEWNRGFNLNLLGNICVLLFAAMGILLYAFERQFLSEQFWSWFTRLFLLWLCASVAIQIIRLTRFYREYALTHSPQQAMVGIVGALSISCTFYFFQWLAISRHARGETLR